MVKQVASICKLSEKIMHKQQNHASISPHNGPTGARFFVALGLLEILRVPAKPPRRSLTAVGALGLAGGEG